jgi:hypothetical protein
MKWPWALQLSFNHSQTIPCLYLHDSTVGIINMQIKSVFLLGAATATTFAADCYDHKGGSWAKGGSSRDTAAWAIRQYVCGGSCSGGCVVDQGNGAWGSQSIVQDGSGGFGGYGACWVRLFLALPFSLYNGWHNIV